MDSTRKNDRAHLQQQEPARRNVLHEADRQRNSRRRSNMRSTLSLHRHEDTRRIFHTTLENSRSITETLLDSTVQERTTSTAYGITWRHQRQHQHQHQHQPQHQHQHHHQHRYRHHRQPSWWDYLVVTYSVRVFGALKCTTELLY